jgi:hypothetical protein
MLSRDARVTSHSHVVLSLSEKYDCHVYRTSSTLMIALEAGCHARPSTISLLVYTACMLNGHVDFSLRVYMLLARASDRLPPCLRAPRTRIFFEGIAFEFQAGNSE